MCLPMISSGRATTKAPLTFFIRASGERSVWVGVSTPRITAVVQTGSPVTSDTP